MPIETVEDHQGYTLRGKGDIVEKLRLMLQKRCLVTAHHQGSKANLVTAIVAVMPEKDLVVFDVGASDSLNRQFAKAGPLVFTAQVDGVRSRFVVEGLIEASLRGEPVFAAPLPESLFWHQQRKFYRVLIPMALPVKCQLALAGDQLEFAVYDLSISGLALCDKYARIGEGIETGLLLKECKLWVPQHGDIPMALEVRNKLPQARLNPPLGQRVGCAFHDLSPGAEIHLQRFIFEMELRLKRNGVLMKR